MPGWDWLNEAQHATAVQAVASVIYTVLTVGVTYFAFGAYQAARRSAEAAIAQLDFARQTAAAERSARNRTAMAEYHRAMDQYRAKLYQDEEQRMRLELVGVGPSTGDLSSFELINQGQSGGLNVRIVDPVAPGDNLLHAHMVPVGGKVKVPLNFQYFMRVGYQCMFVSGLGSTWTILLRLEGRTIHEEIVSIHHGFEAPTEPILEGPQTPVASATN